MRKHFRWISTAEARDFGPPAAWKRFHGRHHVYPSVRLPSFVTIEEVVGIIDWEFAGWYSHCWEYTSAWFGNLVRTGWQDCLSRFFETFPAEVRWRKHETSGGVNSDSSPLSMRRYHTQLSPRQNNVSNNSNSWNNLLLF